MRVITADQLRLACAKVRDDLTDLPGAMIYPLGCDIIARSPHLAALILKALEELPPIEAQPK